MISHTKSNHYFHNQEVAYSKQDEVTTFRYVSEFINIEHRSILHLFIELIIH
jgi:hypothetical protein